VLRVSRPLFAELQNSAMAHALWFIQNWALSLRGRDSIGHFLGGVWEFSDDQLRYLLQSYIGGGPSASRARHAHSHQRQRASSPATPAPVSSTKPANPIKSTLNQLGGVVKNVGGVVKNVGSVVKHAGGTVGQVVGRLGLGGGGSQGSSSSGSGVSKLLNYLLAP
jgi:hypothetical protein